MTARATSTGSATRPVGTYSFAFSRTAAGEDAYKAAMTNYMFIAHESITTEDALQRLG